MLLFTTILPPTPHDPCLLQKTLVAHKSPSTLVVLSFSRKSHRAGLSLKAGTTLLWSQMPTPALQDRG